MTSVFLLEVLSVDHIENSAVTLAKEWQASLPDDLKNSVYASQSKWKVTKINTVYAEYVSFLVHF